MKRGRCPSCGFYPRPMMNAAWIKLSVLLPAVFAELLVGYLERHERARRPGMLLAQVRIGDAGTVASATVFPGIAPRDRSGEEPPGAPPAA